MSLEAGADGFIVPHAGLVAKQIGRLSSTPSPDNESQFNKTPQITISDLSEAELARQKLQLELEALQKKRNTIEKQMEEARQRQEKGKSQLRKSISERDLSRSELREITGGSNFLPLSLTLGAAALGRSVLEQRRKKVEGTIEMGW